MEQAKSSTSNTEQLWTYFKEKLLETIDKNIPSKTARPKNHHHGLTDIWVLKQLKKKSRLYV